MPLNFNKINNVSPETKSAISRKSAQTLPNNPSERGYSAEEIKRRFYQPILDAANSALAEIDRVVNEANTTFNQVSDELDNFIDTTKITEAYKIELDNTSWILNESTQMYEIIVSKEEHQIQDYKEIGVNMFLLDGEGKYTQVNQFEVGIDGSVRCFHETNGAGYLSIYVKREGFIIGNTIVDADHVVGLAKVGRSNSFKDLDDQPNLEAMTANSILISKIASGEQKVGRSVHAQECDTATYAKTSSSAETCEKAASANRATADQNGVNFVTGYARTGGEYPDMSVGNAKKAIADGSGTNIESAYAKQSGTYKDMTVGNSLNQAEYKEISLEATVKVVGNGGTAAITCGFATFKGYGIKMCDTSNNSLYWVGNLYSTSFRSLTFNNYSTIEEIILDEITDADKIVSGGILSIYDDGYLHAYPFISKKTDNEESSSRYFSSEGSGWHVGNPTSLSITNFIAKIG